MSEFYGTKRREKNRKEAASKALVRATEALAPVWASWEAEGVDEIVLQRTVYKLQKDQFTNSQDQLALRQAFKELIDQKSGHYPDLTKPGDLPNVKRRPPTKTRDWMVKGQQVRSAGQKALEYWRKNTDFPLEEAMQWMLFSAIVWGGLNNEASLAALVSFVQEKRKIQFLNDNPVCHLAINSPNYGNVLVDESLRRAQIFVPDAITSLWLIRLYRTVKVLRPIDPSPLMNLPIVREVTGLTMPLTQLLYASSYVWEQQRGATAPQELVCVAQGSQLTCDLSIQELNRVLDTRYPPEPRHPSDRQAPIDQPSETEQPADEGSRGLHPQYDPKRAKAFLKRVRHLVNSEPARVQRVSVELSELEQDIARLYSGPEERRLLGWIVSMIPDRKNLRISSINRYVSAVADKWLMHAAGLPLDHLEAEEWEEIYGLITSDEDINDNVLATAINRFHKFQVERFDAPLIELNSGERVEHCRARFMKPQFARYMLALVHIDNDINQLERKMFQCIFLLAWRTGMRINEIMSLQIRDIECNGIDPLESSRVSTLIVRSNEFGKIKTPSANRRIPVRLLMTSEELALLDGIWRYRLSEGARKRFRQPLFKPVNSDGPFSYSYLRSIFSQLVRQVDPEADYTFHSLRHTALSTLALVLTHQDCLLSHFSDLSDHHFEQIRAGLLGQHPGNNQHLGQDHHIALALLAGHATPDQTFRSYYHLSGLDLGTRLAQSTLPLPSAIYPNIARITRRQLAVAIDGHTDRTESVDRHATVALVNKTLSQWSEPWSVTLGEELASRGRPILLNGELEESDTERSDFEVFPGMKKTSITMSIVYSVIQDYESNVPISTIATRFDLKPDLIKRWVERAERLAALTSGRGSSKLIDPERVRNSAKLPLLPVYTFSDEERKLVKQALDWAPNAYRYYPKEFLEFINIYLKRVTGSRASIRFTVNQEDELLSFIDVALKMLPCTCWTVHAADTSVIRRIRKVNSKERKELKFNQKPLANYSGYAISLSHPNESLLTGKGKKRTHYSSGILRYVMHMFMIAWPGGDLSGRILHRDPIHYGLKKIRRNSP